MIKFYHMESLFFRVMAWLTRKIDPKLEKYRPAKPTPPPFAPESGDELVAVIKRTPKRILSTELRDQMLADLSVQELHVADIMFTCRQMAIIHSQDKLGPLLLDKLHKTGAKIFPVIDEGSQICGLVNTDIFDIHKISENSDITSYLDTNVVYVSPSYPLVAALNVFLRNRTDYCLVVDEKMRIKGYLTLGRLMQHLVLASAAPDDFSDDTDPLAVGARQFD
jgi:Mg2+/Co2+ transporter CorC